ncbi:MAG: hypothetical protein H6510_09535 [Acidobacteria bacterium]|nr:hypothetical protein [Acidobacteriota bacterium]MCB9398047.1 hypothetical protein [Acidobacteriota bacterium]
MGWLFKSEIEKELERWQKECPELEIKFTEAKEASLSYVYTVNHDSILIAGFEGDLASVNLDVRNVENGYTFVSKILKRGKGSKGETLFLLSLPKKLYPPARARDERITVYPKATFECIVTTNRGNQSVVFPVVDISLRGCALVNVSGVVFKMGTSLYQGMMRIDENQGVLVNCQITSIRRVVINGAEQEILGCKFTVAQELITPLLSQARLVGRTIRSTQIPTGLH